MSEEFEEEPVGDVTASPRRWRFDKNLHLNALLHFFVLAVMLAALNWLFARSDPGWTKLNPSPWIILSFYLGFRFGISWGIGSGLFLVVSRIWMANAQLPEGESFEISGLQIYLLWGIVLAGAIGGFFRAVISRKEYQKDMALHDSLSSNQNLKNQIALLKHNEQDLASALVGQNIESSGLILGLQDVIDQNTETEQDQAFLTLLNDLCGVKSASIYYLTRGGRGLRVALMQSDGAFPETIERTPMIDQAERTGKIVTQRWFWEPFEPHASGGYDDYFLAVVAHPKDRGYRVLVISRMDFEQIHWENFWKLESAFRWFENSRNSSLEPTETPLDIVTPRTQDPIKDALPEKLVQKEKPTVEVEQAPRFSQPDVKSTGNGSNGQSAGKAILDGPAFKVRLGQCRQIEEQMGVEHRLVVFVPGEDETNDRCEAFGGSLSATMPTSDDLALIPSDGGRFVYGLITAAPSNEAAEKHAGFLLEKLPDLDLRFFVLRLNDEALNAFVS